MTRPSAVAEAARILRELGAVDAAELAAEIRRQARERDQWTRPPVPPHVAERRRAERTEALRRLQDEMRGTTPETWWARQRGEVAK